MPREPLRRACLGGVSPPGLALAPVLWKSRIQWMPGMRHSWGCRKKIWDWELREYVPLEKNPGPTDTSWIGKQWASSAPGFYL